MTPDNRPIYHCVNCGSVLSQEPYRLPPFCCGHEMAKAGEETPQADAFLEFDSEIVDADGQVFPRWWVPQRKRVLS